MKLENIFAVGLIVAFIMLLVVIMYHEAAIMGCISNAVREGFTVDEILKLCK